MSLTRKIVLNTAVNVAGQGTSYLLGAVSVMLTMRYLGPELFGSYSLVLVYVGIVGGLAELGGQIILVREINQKPAESSRIIGNFLLLKAALYLLAFALGMGATWLMGYKGDMRFLLVLGLLSMLVSFPVSLGAVFQARLKIWYSVAINLGGKVIGVAVVLAMVWLKRGLDILLWGNILIAVLSAAVYWIMVGRQEKPDYRPDWKLLSGLLRQSAPIGLLVIVGGLVFRSDVLLLSKFSDPLSLGLYSAAYKYVEWGLLVTTGAVVSHLPVFSQYLITEPEKVKRLFRISFDIIGLFLIPVSVFVGFNAAALIRLVSGADYVEGAAALAVLIWVVLLNSWNAMAVNMLIANHKMKSLLLLYFPVMAVNIAVNYFGIPKYGFMICTVSSVLSEVLAMGPLLVMMWKWYDLSPIWPNTAKHLLLSTVATGPMFLVPSGHVAARVAVYIVVWTVLGVVSKILNVDRLKDIFNKVRVQA
ncbi:MAG: oligosaccharide flippase family protein [bacterium]|nr:oligosaccharide flippase family protein [bacterium]